MYKISLLTIIIIIFTPYLALGIETDYFKPENILKFADYLYQEGDYIQAAGEYQRYLFYSPENTSIATYKIGLCYRHVGDTRRAISFFQKITEDDLHFDASYQIAYTNFRSSQYDTSIKFLDKVLNDINDPDQICRLQILKAFNLMHKKRWKDAGNLLDSLSPKYESLKNLVSKFRLDAKEGEDLPRKNPGIAAFLSAVIPGAGKIYCREYGDGIYSLIIVGITAYAAFSGFKENGTNSISGWIFGGLSMIFYTGDVYGSAISAKIYNNQLETAILERLPSLQDE